MLNLRELSSDKPDLKECKVKLSAAIQSLNAFLRAERNPERMGEYFLAVSNALHDFAKLIAKYEPGENYFSFSILLEQMGLPTQFVPQILAAAYSHSLREQALALGGVAIKNIRNTVKKRVNDVN